jgi:hypothetical protein
MRVRLRSSLSMCLTMGVLAGCSSGESGTSGQSDTSRLTAAGVARSAASDLRRIAHVDAATAEAAVAFVRFSATNNRLYVDKQRLYVSDTGSLYGPIVQISAFDRVGDWDEEDFAEAALPVAFIHVYGDANYPLNEGYTNLHLDNPNTKYCLFMSLETSPKRWLADIQPTVDELCVPPEAVAPGRLTVQEAKHSSHTKHTDYPATARFGHDASLRPIIIVKCGDKMCEIGPSAGFTQAPPWHPKNWKQGRIKSWQDEQRLGVKDGSDPIKPSKFKAVILPLENIKAFRTPRRFDCRYKNNNICSTEATDDPNDWVAVAVINVDMAQTDEAAFRLTKYHTKLKLEPGENTIWIRKSGDSDSTIYNPDMTVAKEAEWDVRITNSAGVKFPAKKIRRTAHPGNIVVGTARFGWDDNDETLWISCAMGCCEVIG